ncbi:SDR family NAD(P)-dependent oxidoreductase [Nocardia flavorosea]|uniref:Mycofactocin-coupled SDR family oxidoreductase n=1 Tax=Nocardia flavorosea TaxID=53429 RepID=A0A846YLG9_9NOCA|nr:SDR family NAD(P)-dependent oxidoreductase [Nocardia flavorosea]NKY57769.1 mycofactocin-coupled SDR family oxidoreductase [Nocardia flavorosea]
MGFLEGQVVVVTGGARGQGRSHALAVAEQGADVVLLDRCTDVPAIEYRQATETDLRETEDLVRRRGVRVLGLVCDVGDHEQALSAVDTVVDRFGRLDVLLANAGVYGGGSIQDADAAVWDEVIASNLTGVFNSLRAAGPQMIEQGYGRVVVTASNQGRTAVPGSVPYVASKWGVIGLVKAAAQDLAPFGINVNGVAPGNTSTPMVHNPALYGAMRPDLANPVWDDVAPALMEHHLQPIALLEPEEITAAVMFLIGPHTPHITGTILDVNAGTAARATA